MSTQILRSPDGAHSEVSRRPTSRMWLYVSMVLVALSAVRIVADADGVTSEGTFRAALISSVPIAMAGLGGLWSERAGVVNIGLEGMMILGTLGAGYFGYHYGIWAGLIGAAALGALGGMLHALATVVFGVDHIVSGVAINIIAAGAAQFLAEELFSDLPGGGPTQSPSLDTPPSITIPGVSDLGARHRREELVPDLGPGRLGRVADHQGLGVHAHRSCSDRGHRLAALEDPVRAAAAQLRRDRPLRPSPSASTSTATSSSR